MGDRDVVQRLGLAARIAVLVVHRERFAEIFEGSALLADLGVRESQLSEGGCLAAAVALNLRFLYFVIALNQGTRPELPIRTFRFSITYLMLLFAALIVDHYLYFPA